MERHFVQELEALKTNIIRMASMVEESMADSLKAVLERSPEIARKVIEREQRVNSFELDNDNAIVDLLALQQPVASDLRFILAALKINNDLERIGDHAVNIAESAITFSGLSPVEIQTDIPRMGLITKEMLRDAIDGFIHNNAASARGVLQNDDLMDAMNKKTINDLIAYVQSNPESLRASLELTRVSRNLERVADLATNIAEEVIFVAEAHVVKHLADKNTQNP
jgi:phosphate transport system protein